tara:strand:- start:558 stop:833 length:276 start_codon:yes stop_codon:yes gene_type:complete
MKTNLKCSFLILFLSSCASGNWQHQSGNNTNLSLDKNFCNSFADSRFPTYLCKNPLMCAPEETSLVISSIAENDAAYRNCMYGKGYNLVDN